MSTWLYSDSSLAVSLTFLAIMAADFSSDLGYFPCRVPYIVYRTCLTASASALTFTSAMYTSSGLVMLVEHINCFNMFLFSLNDFACEIGIKYDPAPSWN